MDRPKDLRTEIAWETARRVVDLLRWDREEQRAEAFVEILLVVEEGFARFVAASSSGLLVTEPGRN